MIYYLAGPYSSNPEANYPIHRDIYMNMVKLGLVTYSPIVTHHHLAHEMELPFAPFYWENLNKRWLRECKHLVRIKGYSPGAVFEVDYFKECHEIDGGTITHVLPGIGKADLISALALPFEPPPSSAA